MYHFSYTISPEDYKEIVRWQVYGEQKERTLWEKGKNLMGKVFLFWFLSIALAVMTGPRPAVILVALGFLICNKKVLYNIIYWRSRQKARRGEPDFRESTDITFDESGLLYECNGTAIYQIYASLLGMAEMEHFLRADGKKGSFLIPKKVVGSEEEIREFLDFVRGKMEENKQQTYILKKVRGEAREKYPYAFYFNRTVDELINSEAEASPVSFLSKWYWTPAKILLWVSAAVFLFIVVVVTWRTGKIVAWTVPFLLVLEILYVGIISRSNFKKRRKKLLKQRASMLDNELVGHQMMAFGEEKFTIFTERGYVEKPWSIIGLLNDNGRDLRLVLRGGSCYLLPRKVFESDESLEEFKDYCGRCIAKASENRQTV